MKKLLSVILALVMCSVAYADSLKIFEAIQENPDGETSSVPLFGLGMSPNGRYVCGAVDDYKGIFIADNLTGEVKWMLDGDKNDSELRHVSNDGVAVGLFNAKGATYTFQSNSIEFLDCPYGYDYVIGEDITNDGDIMIGTLVESSLLTYAAYKTKGGEWIKLPIPSKGAWESNYPSLTYYAGSAAKHISKDGRVILGHLGNFNYPIVWIKNEAGEYEWDFFYSRYVKDSSTDTDNSKPLYGISGLYGMNVSNNGRYFCMLGTVRDNAFSDTRNVPAVYDTVEKTLKVYSEEQEFDVTGQGLWPIDIADDGTFIGTVGMPYMASRGSFIWKAGDSEAKLWGNEFPVFNEKLGESDDLGFNVPTLMSADAKLLGGYTYYSANYLDDSQAARYITYVINTTQDPVNPDPVDPINPGDYPFVTSPDNGCLDNASWVGEICMDNALILDIQNRGIAVTDLIPNYESNNLYIWDNTLSGYDSSKTPDGVSFEVGNLGWSGAGFNVSAYPGVDLSMINDDTHFHFEYCSPSGYAPESIGLFLLDGESNEKSTKPLRFSVGSDFDDNGTIFPSIGPKAGTELTAIDVTIGELKKLWPDADLSDLSSFNGNVFSFIAGDLEHSTFAFKNVYFYNEKKEEGDNYYLVGSNVNGYIWSNGELPCRFNYLGDGVYEWRGNYLSTAFKINDGSWDHDVNFGSPDRESVIIAGEPFYYINDGTSSNFMFEDDVLGYRDPVVILNVKEGYITVTGTPVFNPWYIVGDFSSWEFIYELTEDGSNVYKCDRVEFNGSGLFKICRTGWSRQYSVEPGSEISISPDNLTAQLVECSGYDESVPVSLKGKYDVIWDFNSLTVTFKPSPKEIGEDCTLTITLPGSLKTIMPATVGQTVALSFSADEYWGIESIKEGESVYQAENVKDLEWRHVAMGDEELEVNLAYLGDLTVWTDLTEIQELDNGAKISLEDGKVMISNLTEGEEICVYTLNGIVARQMKAESTAVMIQLESGTPYIIRIGSKAIRVML